MQLGKDRGGWEDGAVTMDRYSRWVVVCNRSRCCCGSSMCSLWCECPVGLAVPYPPPATSTLTLFLPFFRQDPIMSSSNSLQSAISFLQDPSIQDSPLNKKIAFLESKGLSRKEIEDAIRLSGGTPPTTGYNVANRSNGVPYNPAATGYNPYSPYGGYRLERQPYDWRDWFVMTTVGGAVGALMYTMARVGTLVSFAR